MFGNEIFILQRKICSLLKKFIEFIHFLLKYLTFRFILYIILLGY